VTLENLNARDKDALNEAEKAAGNLSEEVRAKLIGKVIPYTRQFSGEDLLKPIERAVRITYDDDQLVHVAWEMGRTIDRVSGNFCGADDDQVSATAKLPAMMTSMQDHRNEIRDMVFIKLLLKMCAISVIVQSFAAKQHLKYHAKEAKRQRNTKVSECRSSSKRIRARVINLAPCLL
jgi:hypothetical protein